MHFDPTSLELPRALQRLLPQPAESGEGLARRTFLKLAGATGFALGAFPLAASAQQNETPSGGLKPTQMPAAFVQIARDGSPAPQEDPP